MAIDLYCTAPAIEKTQMRGGYMTRMKKPARIRVGGLLWRCVAIVIVIHLSILLASAAPPPLGDPNEVWVSTSSGDTLVVGEQVKLEFYFANANPLDIVQLHMGIKSPDSATWEWIKPVGGYGNDPTREYVTIVPGSRLDGSFDWFLVDLFSNLSDSSLGGPDQDSLEIYATTWELTMDAGPLEHMWNLHFIPTHTGTICVDSIRILHQGLDPWCFGGSGDPSWAGPFCFEVVEPVAGDINCDGQANVMDAVYLINWIFRGGPPPCR
jgi:hypothetical protein